MTDLLQLLAKHTTQAAALAATEAEIKKQERAYWKERGFSVLPRRERLLAALREDLDRDAAMPTPLEKFLAEGRAFDE